MQNTEKDAVVVIGAGIVGLCCAYHLRKSGRKVILVDRSLPGTGCSYGPSGALSDNSITPIGMPGVLGQAPKMLLNPNSPLSIPFHYIREAAPWLYSFVKSSTPERVEQIADSLRTLLTGSADAHREILRDIGALDLISDGGQLHVYPDRASFDSDHFMWRIRFDRGLIAEPLFEDQLRDLEPALSDRYQAAMFMPGQAWIRDPYAYSKRLYHAIAQEGCRFVQGEVSKILRGIGKWHVMVSSNTIEAEDVIVCSGVHTRELLAPYIQLPLISQRGYHLHLLSPNVKISNIISLTDRKAFVTPMGDAIRIGGTVEFDDPDAPPNDRRAALLAGHLEHALKGINVKNATRWMGNRPCCPDSMPLIGSPQGLPGLWYAAGHGHLGLTGSANTAALLADSVNRRQVNPTLTKFGVERFA